MKSKSCEYGVKIPAEEVYNRMFSKALVKTASDDLEVVHIVAV